MYVSCALLAVTDGFHTPARATVRLEGGGETGVPGTNDLVLLMVGIGCMDIGAATCSKGAARLADS